MRAIDSLNRFLEIYEMQTQEWRQDNREPEPFKRRPVIAISRKPGCDGEPITGDAPV